MAKPSPEGLPICRNERTCLWCLSQIQGMPPARETHWQASSTPSALTPDDAAGSGLASYPFRSDPSRGRDQRCIPETSPPQPSLTSSTRYPPWLAAFRLKAVHSSR